MNTYAISRLAPEEDIFTAAKAGPCAPISNYRWQQDYTPRAEAFLAWNDRALRVCLTAWEQEIRCELRGRNDLVCTDSCLEFFFAPKPKEVPYFNFEVNPLGVLYVGFSPSGDRAGSDKIPDARICIGRGPASFWQVAYDVPYEFIRRFVPDFAIAPGSEIQANFYKCGEYTATPHWGSWNPIELPAPDFHQRPFFGRILVE